MLTQTFYSLCRHLHETLYCLVLQAYLWHELGPLDLHVPRHQLLFCSHCYYLSCMYTTAILLGEDYCHAKVSQGNAKKKQQTQYTTPGAKGHCINVPLFFFANGIWVRTTYSTS